jgi:hypothetical protein
MTLDIELKKKVEPILLKAENLTIESAQDLTVATDLLSNLNKISDRIEEEKEKVTKPLNQALKAERARWKPIETMYENAVSYIRKQMTTYQTEQLRIQKEEEMKIASRVGEGKGKIKLETAVRKIEELNHPASVVSTDNGIVKFRTVRRFEVMDIPLLPIQYLIPDETAIKAQMVAGNELPGVRYFEEQIPINYR